MTATELQLGIGFITVFGSGISVYVGVKVALTELKSEVKRIDNRVTDKHREVDRRLGSLEAKVFK